MIETSLIFNASSHSCNQQSAAAKQHPTNFAQMLTNPSSQVKEQSTEANTSSDVAQPENQMSSISDFYAEEVTTQIDEPTALSTSPQFTPLIANQFIAPSLMQLAEATTQLQLASRHAPLADETIEQWVLNN
ncbi:MAG: hypothetical protein AB8W37_08475 [Arsenophonus endosymbiont of Dermacentor nuttalli]